MTQTALFVDQNDRVILKHYQTDKLTPERLNEAALVLDRSELPAVPEVSETERAVMYIRNGSPVYEIETKSGS